MHICEPIIIQNSRGIQRWIAAMYYFLMFHVFQKNNVDKLLRTTMGKEIQYPLVKAFQCFDQITQAHSDNFDVHHLLGNLPSKSLGSQIAPPDASATVPSTLRQS